MIMTIKEIKKQLEKDANANYKLSFKFFMNKTQ